MLSFVFFKNFCGIIMIMVIIIIIIIIALLPSSSPRFRQPSLAFAVAVLASLVVAGLFMGLRMRRSSSPVYTDQSMVSLE